MQNVKLSSFQVVGISVRTSNATGQALHDIQGLWNRFMTDQIMEKIPNKVDAAVYAVYTEYEGDHLKPYTMILGCKVSQVAILPEGFVSTTIQAGNYTQYNPKGNLNDGIVVKQWQQIWESDLKRNYQTDFEIYGEKAANPADAEVDIFIGVD